MTRIKLLTFAVTFLLIFSIIATVFGRSGAVVNSALRSEAEEMTRERERKEAEVSLLRDSLADCGKSGGGDGDAVFIATLPAEVPRDRAEDVPGEADRDADGGFTGLSGTAILLISLFSAAAVTLALSFLPAFRRLGERDGRRKERKSYQGGPSSYDDIDFV